MNRSNLLFLLLFSGAGLAAQQTDLYFVDYPAPSPDAKTIYFSYDGDIWSVPTDGGLANRLTAMDGIETNPKVSPDGQWVAFTGRQYGNPDVFIMPVGGGPITQLTFHQASDQVASWSWDSRWIYFESSRFNTLSTYRIPVNGGTPQRLFGDDYFNFTHNLAEHPDGSFFFNESWESSLYAHRKGYRGAFNPDIKSYNPQTKAYREWTDYEGKDFWPTIDRQGKVYFVSDEFNGQYNLCTFENGKKKRLTKFDRSIWNPAVSADGSLIVFRLDYQLYAYDVKSGKSRKVPMRAARNSTLEQSQDFKVDGNITEFDVSADGKKIAFVSRGELFVSDIEGKFVRRLDRQSAERVVEVYWLSGDTALLFNQTLQGYLNWYAMPADGSDLPRRLTNDRRNNRQLAFNSDQTQAVYLSGRDELRRLDLSNFQSELLVKDEFWGYYNDQPGFSPDDRYILYTAYRNFERDIFVYDQQTTETHNLTQTGVTEAGPSWSPDGKYIYLVSNRTQPNYPYGLQEPDMYRLPLQAFDPPYRSDKWDELFVKEGGKEAKEEKGEKEEKGGEEEEKPEVRIDREGLLQRLERVGPSFGSQSAPYVVQKDDKTILLYNSNHDEGESGLWKTVMEPFEKTKTEKIKDVSSMNDLEEAKGKYYLLSGGNLYKLDLDGGKAEKINVQHSFRRQLRAEFEQMYYEAWANLEENFYNETFHGVDWPAKRDQYAAFLPYVNSRADLRQVLNELMGELNTSHFRFTSSGKEEEVYYGSHSLSTGLLFDSAEPYRVSRIVRRSPADRSGKDVQPGDELVAVDGLELDPAQNREAYFSRPSIDDEMALTFRRADSTFTVKFHPVDYHVIRNLLYDEWQERNQRLVDDRGDRTVAYVHMKNMGGGELQSFLEDMVSEAHLRKGLILDLRYNTGGNVHNDVLQFLSQRTYLQWKYREGALSSQPHFAPSDYPIVLLINEQSLSDAEMTTAGFKELGLGTVIGAETYRWIIFTSGKTLVDGSFYRLPSWGCYTLDGQNLEQTGVAPDIEVRNTFLDRLNGKDPQLERAIQEVLESRKMKDKR